MNIAPAKALKNSVICHGTLKKTLKNVVEYTIIMVVIRVMVLTFFCFLSSMRGDKYIPVLMIALFAVSLTLLSLQPMAVVSIDHMNTAVKMMPISTCNIATTSIFSPPRGTRPPRERGLVSPDTINNFEFIKESQTLYTIGVKSSRN